MELTITRLVIVLIGATAGLWQVLLGAKARERIVYKAKQPLHNLDTALRLCFPIVTLIWIFQPQRLAAAEIHLPLSIQWVGIATMICGWLGWLWSQASLGRQWSEQTAVQKGHQTVSYGPYRFVRHPMYGSFMLIGIGGLLATHNLAPCLLLLGHVAIVALRSPIEEKMLSERVPGYTQYLRKTRWRFIPHFL